MAPRPCRRCVGGRSLRRRRGAGARPDRAARPRRRAVRRIRRRCSRRRGDLLRPSDKLLQQVELERPALRPRRRPPRQPVRARHGERLFRRGRGVGAALSPGDAGGFPRHRPRHRGQGDRRRLSRCRAGVRRLSGRDPEKPADHPRRAQPGRAAPRNAAEEPRRRHPAREARRRRLYRRLADLGRNRPARAWPSGLHDPRPEGLHPVVGELCRARRSGDGDRGL